MASAGLEGVLRLFLFFPCFLSLVKGGSGVREGVAGPNNDVPDYYVIIVIFYFFCSFVCLDFHISHIACAVGRSAHPYGTEL